MLIRFSVENWMSFRDKAVLSMIATSERQHRERIPVVEKYKLKVLPVAALYGANASGKTNLFKAISFAKRFIVQGNALDSPIQTEPFRLDEACFDQPSKFSFELLVGSDMYEYSFAVNRKAVVEERLVKILRSSEKVLYHRIDGCPNFSPEHRTDRFLEFAFQGTRDNQLFLTNSVSQKAEAFKPVFDWFRHSLVLVAPDSRFEPFEQFFDENSPLSAKINELLPLLDTGVDHLKGENLQFESLQIPANVKTQLLDIVKEDGIVRVQNETTKDKIIVTRKNGDLTAKKLVTYHIGVGGTPSRFELSSESDGTNRVLDLLPAFLDLSDKEANRVYIIDEIDRSLHTLLTRQLIDMFLSGCGQNTRSQLLFTTHDVLLMDQQLLRRDEMWVAERSAIGASCLYSFSEFKDVRYDKDIRKSYLQGRLGGIPRLLLCCNANRKNIEGSKEDCE